MAIGVSQFPLLNHDYFGEALNAYQQGMKFPTELKMSKQDLIEKQLRNKLLEPQAEMAPQITRESLLSSMLKNKMDNLDIKQKEAELPYADQMAKSTALYKEAMAKYLLMPNQNLKYLSGVGRTFIEPGVVNSIQEDNSIPGKNKDFDSDEINNTYDLYRQKMTTDSSSRQKNLYAANIEKTLDFINPDDLVQYSSIGGHIQKLADEASTALGNNNERYERYKKSENSAKLLATQARQFYGDSIQPDMIERLEKLTNPSTWSSNPKLAKALFLQTKAILKSELQTYRDSSKSTDVYKGKKSSSNSPKETVYVRVNGKLQRQE